MEYIENIIKTGLKHFTDVSVIDNLTKIDKLLNTYYSISNNKNEVAWLHRENSLLCCTKILVQHKIKDLEKPKKMIPETLNKINKLQTVIRIIDVLKTQIK